MTQNKHTTISCRQRYLGPIEKELYDLVKNKIKRGVPREDILNSTYIGHSTFSKIRSTGSYDEYQKLNKRLSQRRRERESLIQKINTSNTPAMGMMGQLWVEPNLQRLNVCLLVMLFISVFTLGLVWASVMGL